MSNIFDITKFDLYKEDNRREVKKANGGLTGFFMGDLLCICKLLRRRYYSGCCRKQ